MPTQTVATNVPNHLWQLLWEYDPNGLIVVDADLYIKLVNPAFCQLFEVKPEAVIGQPAETILGDVNDFKRVWETGAVIRNQMREYQSLELLVNQIIFSIEDEGIIACIMTDFSHQLTQKHQLNVLRQETIKQVNEVVDHQMQVVQEIAGLLGETTAETKISLLKVIQMLQHEATDSLSLINPDAKA
jgi:transcriptional regulator with PAS, ATPase and Fis domain